MTITIKKGINKVYVYENNILMWTEDLLNPLKSYGATKYAKYVYEKEV